jgi:hypothetical protein
MSDYEPATTDTKVVPNALTWHYLGDRDVADAAYCHRFGVPDAPEPLLVRGVVWIYALPVASTRS